jgi:Leucine-rich repeat (LRR) protein
LLHNVQIYDNGITSLHSSLGNLIALRTFYFDNPLSEFPPFIRRFRGLEKLGAGKLGISTLPEWLSELTQLEEVHFHDNKLQDIPASLAQLSKLSNLFLENNPLNPELAAA